jgi:hypothetical protein
LILIPYSLAAQGSMPDAPSNSARPLPSSNSEKNPGTEEGKLACLETAKKTTRPDQRDRLTKFCDRISRLPSCVSVENRPIQHAEFTSKDSRGKRILVLGLIHGDEPLAGELAIDWSQRLEALRAQKIEPRNSWRVVPMLNPDGLERQTRMNARGVDLNRNFPTKDWNTNAVKFWKQYTKADPRRFPGTEPGSEAETQCAIAHIKDLQGPTVARTGQLSRKPGTLYVARLSDPSANSGTRRFDGRFWQPSGHRRYVRN